MTGTWRRSRRAAVVAAGVIAMATAATTPQLSDMFPALVSCNPAETYGCISRCVLHSSLSPAQKLCASLRCFHDCTSLSSRECALEGAKACRLFNGIMLSFEEVCGVDCE